MCVKCGGDSVAGLGGRGAPGGRRGGGRQRGGGCWARAAALLLGSARSPVLPCCLPFPCLQVLLRLFPQPVFRNIALQCLAEVSRRYQSHWLPCPPLPQPCNCRPGLLPAHPSPPNPSPRAARASLPTHPLPVTRADSGAPGGARVQLPLCPALHFLRGAAGGADAAGHQHPRGVQPRYGRGPGLRAKPGPLPHRLLPRAPQARASVCAWWWWGGRVGVWFGEGGVLRVGGVWGGVGGGCVCVRSLCCGGVGQEVSVRLAVVCSCSSSSCSWRRGARSAATLRLAAICPSTLPRSLPHPRPST